MDFSDLDEKWEEPDPLLSFFRTTDPDLGRKKRTGSGRPLPGNRMQFINVREGIFGWVKSIPGIE
jgi:hypothetical protein